MSQENFGTAEPKAGNFKIWRLEEGDAGKFRICEHVIQIHFLGYENKLKHAWIDLIQYAINIFWTVGKFYQQIRVNRATLLQN